MSKDDEKKSKMDNLFGKSKDGEPHDTEILKNSEDEEEKTNDKFREERIKAFSEIIDEIKNVNCYKKRNLDDFKLCVGCEKEASKTCSKDRLITMISEYLEKYHRVPYSYLFKIFADDNELELEVIYARLISLANILYDEENESKKNKEIADTLVRIYDNIDLASNQNSSLQKVRNAILASFSSQSKKLTEDQEKLDKSVKCAEEEINKAKEEINQTKKDIKEIQKDLISIVAIFVGISFVMFGGMSLLNGLFNFEDMSYVPIVELLCLGSLFGLVIIYATYLFMKFILCITGKDKEPLIKNSKENSTKQNKYDESVFPNIEQVNKSTKFIWWIFICTIVIWLVFTGFRILTNDKSEFDIGTHHINISIIENEPKCDEKND